MPNSVLITFGVECMLIIVTTLLLSQPEFIFKSATIRIQSMAKWGGVFLLCLTFCWSIVLGIILSVNGLSLRI